MTKLVRMGVMMAAACLFVSSATGTAVAWHRGHVETFADNPSSVGCYRPRSQGQDSTSARDRQGRRHLLFGPITPVVAH